MADYVAWKFNHTVYSRRTSSTHLVDTVTMDEWKTICGKDLHHLEETKWSSRPFGRMCRICVRFQVRPRREWTVAIRRK